MRASTWLSPSCSRSSRIYIENVSAVPYRATFVRLLAFLRPYRFGLAVSVVLAVGSQAAQIALVWITGRDAIDHALLEHDTRRLRWTVVALIAIGLVRALLMAGRRLLSGQIALDVEMDMRSGLYAHMVRLSFGFRYAAAGPIVQKEHSGWDTTCAVAKIIWPDLTNAPGPPPILQKNVDEGRIGFKTRRGFFEWNDESMAKERARYERALRKCLEIFKEEGIV